MDISISNLDGFKTSVYHKSTYTGLHTNFKCFAPHEYKKRLINTLLDRIFKINSSWKGFDLDVKSLCQNLMRNMYPKRMIDRVGRTHLHYNTRCEQHLRSDKNSSIFKHLASNTECKESCNKDSFKILDNARTRYELALKEGMQIKWRKPSLNIQKKHEILKLLV